MILAEVDTAEVVGPKQWHGQPISLDAVRAPNKQVSIFWDDTDGVWGRVCQKSLLTYAHLLLVIYNKSLRPGQRGYQVDWKENVKNKTFGAAASKQGFQITSYIRSINNLLKKGVSMLFFILHIPILNDSLSIY